MMESKPEMYADVSQATPDKLPVWVYETFPSYAMRQVNAHAAAGWQVIDTFGQPPQRGIHWLYGRLV